MKLIFMTISRQANITNQNNFFLNYEQKTIRNKDKNWK